LCKGATLGFGDCGSEPPKTTQVTVDSRTGAEATVRTSGTAGLELDWTVDAGSVGAKVGYDVNAHDPGPVRRGEMFSLAPGETLSFGELDTQSPTAKASAKAVLDMTVDATGRACAIGFGCTSGSSRIVDIDGAPEIVGLTPTELKFADGLTPPGVDLSVPIGQVAATVNLHTGVPPAIPPSVSVDVNGFTIGTANPGAIIDLATIEAKIPEVQATGGLSGGKIKAEGDDEILSLKADIDATVPGVPLGGAGFGVGPLSVTLDGFDIEAGPTMSLLQQFELVPELMVELAFDKPVSIDGHGLGTDWSGLWRDLPDLAVFEPTMITPTFSLGAMLTSTHKLQFGAELTVDLLKASLGAGFGPISASWDIGPLVDFSFPFTPNFAQVSLHDDTFAFGGFNEVQLSSFLIAPIPLPASVLLMAAGVATLPALRRFRRAA